MNKLRAFWRLLFADEYYLVTPTYITGCYSKNPKGGKELIRKLNIEAEQEFNDCPKK